MGTASMGSQAQMAFDTALPFDTSSIPIEFRSESLAKTGTIIDASEVGIRGTRQRVASRTRTGTYTVAGQIVIAVSRITLDNLLPAIQGGSESLNVFDFAETIPEFQLMIDRNTKVFTYTGCKVSKATFSGTDGDLLLLTLDIEAETESVGASGTFPALTFPTDKPFIFNGDSALTLLGTGSRAFKDFSITIDNVLVTDKFDASLTRTDIPSQDRIVTFSCDSPYTTDEVDMYGQALAGAAATLVCTNAEEASTVLTFAMATLQVPDLTPTVNSKGEVRLRIEGVARNSGSANDLIITNAHA